MRPRLPSAIARRWRLLTLAHGRFTRHFAAAIGHGALILSVLCAIAAIGCIVCLLLYFGIDRSDRLASGLSAALHAAQLTFVTAVAYNLVFRFRALARSTPPLMWGVYALLLLTVAPLIYPRPHSPWIPWLDTILYSRHFLFSVLAVYSVLELSFGLMRVIARRTNPSLLLSASFLFFILLGSLALMLPRCTVVPISYIDSLFVATSAVCITGLTPVDVGATFTPLGLTVLAVLMQIGGLGVLTFTSFFAIFFSGTTSVYNQMLVRDLVYSKTMNSLFPTLLYILAFTLTVEALGAVAVYLTTPPELGLTPARRIAFAAFHSLSSFCNAGFTNIPGGMSNAALMAYGQSLYTVTSVLIFAGAIGFPILVNFKDILAAWLRRAWAALRGVSAPSDIPLHLFDLNTKLVLVTSVGILVFSSVAFFFLEYHNTLAGLSLPVKINQAVFNSLTPRSAGFVSVSPADFLPLTMLLVVVQMCIGGASQSLGGGIKVNTVAAVFLNVRAILTGSRRPWAFRRTISIASVRRANTVIVLAIASFLIITALLLALEPAMPLRPLLFEITSALFTVGSSLGATPLLAPASKAILCVAMFIGRVGIISLLAGFIGQRRDFSQYLPEENIIIN